MYSNYFIFIYFFANFNEYKKILYNYIIYHIIYHIYFIYEIKYIFIIYIILK